MKSKKLAAFLLLLTAVGILIYWVLVFSGVFPVSEIIPGYKNWFMSFPIADGWIAACALLSLVFLIRNNPLASLFGIAAGSSLIFLGLYALLYGINTGLIFNLTIDELIEIAIKIYCLSTGTYLMIYFWRIRNSYD